jgi:hypothetical protein
MECPDSRPYDLMSSGLVGHRTGISRGRRTRGVRRRLLLLHGGAGRRTQVRAVLQTIRPLNEPQQCRRICFHVDNWVTSLCDELVRQ